MHPQPGFSDKVGVKLLNLEIIDGLRLRQPCAAGAPHPAACRGEDLVAGLKVSSPDPAAIFPPEGMLAGDAQGLGCAEVVVLGEVG